MTWTALLLVVFLTLGLSRPHHTWRTRAVVLLVITAVLLVVFVGLGTSGEPPAG